MACDGRRRPVPPTARSIRKRGASIRVLVTGTIVRLACVSLKRSDCTTTAGRGLPVYEPPPATLTTSPRFKRSILDRREHRGAHGRSFGATPAMTALALESPDRRPRGISL